MQDTREKTKKEKQRLGYMNRDMQRTVIKIIIMWKLKENGEMYAYAILKDIKKIKHPFIKDNPQIKNEVYNTLKALEQAGYIKEKSRRGNKHVKVYYELTKEGISALKATKSLLHETARSMARILG